MLTEKIELVQLENWREPDKTDETPIFLIHDGGGTTFAYHCLESLGRSVYGIRNPHFFNGKPFEGGLPGMGSLYTQWIREAVTSPRFPKHRDDQGRIRILLGGWSLGGMLSLEVARQLANDSMIHVAGILMIDSFYPAVFQEPDSPRGVTAPSEEGLTKNEVLSRRCMVVAMRMARTWEPPVWDEADAGERPKAVLLRATQVIPPEVHPFPGLDLQVPDEVLGWSAYDANIFDAVLDVEGHHFDLFAFSRVDATTAVIKHALDILDKEPENEKSRKREWRRRSFKSFWRPWKS